MKIHKLLFPGVNENKVNGSRTAVRAVIPENATVLLLYAKNLGVYTLPGGGVEEGEELEQALKREVLEECGARINLIREKLFIVDEFRSDTDTSSGSFRITSHYYLCRIDKAMENQQLTEKEIKKGIVPVRVSLAEALETNKKVLQSKDNSEMPWLTRETFTLQELISIV